MATRKPVVKASPLPTRQQWHEWVASQCAANPSFIAPNQLCVEDVKEWEQASTELTKLKAKEVLLRLKIFKHYFPTPTEGSNNAEMPDGTLVKGTAKVNRTVDEAALAALKLFTVGQMRSHLEALKIDVSSFGDDVKVTDALRMSMDKLIKYKPDVAITEYRTLTAEQCAVFETCLVIKPGTPELDIVPPKVSE